MTPLSSFDIDSYPGKAKILFVGDPSSSHVHSWIDLLGTASINVRLFGLPTGYPPAHWKVKTYLTFQYIPDNLDPSNRKWLYPTPNELLVQQRLKTEAQLQQTYLLWQESLKQDALWLNAFAQELLGMKSELKSALEHDKAEIKKDLAELKTIAQTRTLYPVYLLNRFINSIKMAADRRKNPVGNTGQDTVISVSETENHPAVAEIVPGSEPVESAIEEVKVENEPADESMNQSAGKIGEATKLDGIDPVDWLEQICTEWQPDIVHTFGLNTASYFYNQVRKSIDAEKKPIWVVQVRGGPDLALNRVLPNHQEQIKEVLQFCDQLIADNQENYEIAVQMGLDPNKKCKLGVLPGTGGIDVTTLSKRWKGLPSKRERIILWPKAYENPQSKALPVIEAIKLAWDQIRPCKIYFLAVIQEEIELNYQLLPDEIRSNCYLMPRVPRSEVLELMTTARILLAPSLSDGIPNALYEAMATGIFPIFSPLETIQGIISDGENGLFARNLYPDEIAHALIRAMHDDDLVDTAAQHNLDLVKQIADRKKFEPLLVHYYDRLAWGGANA